MIHGDGDRCTPLGQAQELYAALLERGVETELVVYPREGHGVQERDHQLDAWRRTVGWFDRYLGSPVMGRAASCLRPAAVRRGDPAPPHNLLRCLRAGPLAPGDPVRALLGRAPAKPETLAAIRERHHLDDPFLVQYGKWLSQVVQGDLGGSIQGNRAVTRPSGIGSASPFT